MLTTGFIIKDYPLAKAQQLVNLYHRHNIQPQGHKFTLALFRDNQADSFYIDDQDYSSSFAVKGFLDSDEYNPAWIEEQERLYYDADTDQYILDTPDGYLIVEPKPDRILNGIAVVGRPVNRYLDDGNTLEITRLCLVDEADADEFDICLHKRNPNHSSSAPSELVAAVCKRAKQLGYSRVITYTRDNENGSYYKAAGFAVEHRQKYARVWKSKNGAAVNSKAAPRPKVRWAKAL